MTHYGTITGAATYAATSARGASWLAETVTNSQREAALVRASRALDAMYGKRFPGTKTGGRAQGLTWPMTGAFDHCMVPPEALPDDVVPVEIENATYALAMVEILTPGALSPNYTPGSVMKREKAGEVERERFTKDEGGAFGLDAMRPQVAEAEDWLRCLMVPVATMQCILRV